MILLGQIEKVIHSVMTDKATGAKSGMVQLVISDKTKPHQFRTATYFTTYMVEEKFRGVFGAVDPVDEKVTVAVAEIAPQNAFMKVKGQLLLGHHTGEALLAMAESAVPTSSAPAPAAAPSKASVQTRAAA